MSRGGAFNVGPVGGACHTSSDVEASTTRDVAQSLVRLTVCTATVRDADRTYVTFAITLRTVTDHDGGHQSRDSHHSHSSGDAPCAETLPPCSLVCSSRHRS